MFGLLTLAPVKADAQAHPMIYLWGINRSTCKVDAVLSDAVAARLLAIGERVQRLQLNPATDVTGCTDKDCAERLKLVCPALSGVLLGGYVEERKLRQDGSPPNDPFAPEDTWQRVRLWRVDLSTNQTATGSFACRGCDPTDLVVRHAAELVEQSAPEPQTLFCPATGLDVLTESEPAGDPERVTLVLSAAAREQRGAQRAITEQLKHHLRLTGRELSIEDNKHGLPLLQLRARHPGQHLLEVAFKAEGELLVQYWDQSATDAAAQKVECFGCTEDDLARRVSIAAGGLLDRCYNQSCRTAPQSVLQRRSTLVCAPINPPLDCEPPKPVPKRGAPVMVEGPPPPDFLSPPCALPLVPTTKVSSIGKTVSQHAYPEPERRRQKMRTAGKVLLSLGAVGLATMAVILASNNEPGIGECADAKGTYANQRCVIAIPQAEPLSIATGTLGGGLLAAGGIVLGLANRPLQISTR